MYKSIGEITKKLLSIEKESELFSFSIKDIYIWELIRYKIYTTVLEHYIEKKKSSNIKLSYKQKCVAFYLKSIKKINKLIYIIRKYPYFNTTKVDSLIFESSRKINYNNHFIDPYTKFLVDELIEAGKKIETIQSSYSYDRLQKNNHSKSIELMYVLCENNYSEQKTQLTKEDTERIDQLSIILQQAFDINFSLKELIKKELFFFKYKEEKFTTFFLKKKPSEIYLVNFCDKCALISAAKKLGIKVIDIQHGLISSDDIIYHYPEFIKNKLHYFPDIFYTWSPIWQEICNIPISSEKIISIGNKYLEARKSAFSYTVKNEKTILIISQPGLTNQIAQYTLDNLDRFENYSIIYKLHPSEYTNTTDFSSLQQLKCNSDILFVDKHVDLYLLFSTSKYVIGVYSTALIEAIDFDCTIYLYNLPGVEMMKHFINLNKIELLNSTHL